MHCLEQFTQELSRIYPILVLHLVQETRCYQVDMGSVQGNFGFSVQFHCLSMCKHILCASLCSSCFIANLLKHCKIKDLCFYTSSVCN